MKSSGKKKFCKEEKIKILGGELLQKSVTRNGKRYNCGIAKDKDGYFACTHRARTKSYLSKKDIPIRELKRIESTG